MARWNQSLTITIGLAALSLAALLLVPPIAQDQLYHGFADQRTLFGVPHFWNVVSNVPFVLVGAAGLTRFREATARILFLGIFLTGFGSTYYHLAPSDGALFWDRLPMTMGFMALLAGAIGERTNLRTELLVLGPLLAIGLLSLLVWQWTDDLRLYGWVQFFPIVAIPLLLWLRPVHSGVAWLLGAGLVYVAAKAFELTDAGVYSALGLSGHTLKHLVAGLSCWMLLCYFTVRRPLAA